MTRELLILIVEDDAVTAECLSDLLSAAGYSTRVLAAPRTIAAVRQTRPDLVLLDLVFPEVRGEELLQALRSDAELAGLPVVLISAVPHLAKVAAGLPVQGYVAKPFDLDTLLQTVGDLVCRTGTCHAQTHVQWAQA
ncbi:MAG TPA: response regulator [Anaerolineae bacterium]|nr:response regulator [Anaerolineae bacterium]HOQ97538.1 response regulator [Anaerolineae bacterium]HPL30945.1 response regulator [Anaerolineae bacterium]